MLFMWLFGLAAGLANACLATGHVAPVGEVRGPLAESVATSPSTPSHHPHEALHDAVAWPGHGDDGRPDEGGSAKANCQDFCSKTSATLPSVKSALDDVQSHVLLAAVVIAAMPARAFAPAQMWVPRRDGVRSPPIPIVFLRLAL